MARAVLSIASEVYPLVKTGGLADVVGALPAALAAHQFETTTLVPGYPDVMKSLSGQRATMQWPDLFGGPARLVEGEAGALSLFALDAPHLYARAGGLYGDAAGKDWPDNWKRFAALGQAGARIARDRAFDVVHAHDWQAAMAPVYLRYSDLAGPPSLITIHNIAFQGRFDASVFAGLGLPPRAFSIEGVEYFGGVGFLKGGMQAADAISTVSPTYAREIGAAEFGMGLEGLVAARRRDVHGILNGIDAAAWNPQTDDHLAARYDARSLARRAANKRALEAAMGLARDEGLLLCVVSRLAWQKGIDLIAAIADGLAARGVRLAILGSGDKSMEEAFRDLAARHHGRIAARIGYDETLSHMMQGGADAIVIPSRFEPCGLTQLYGLRYGCIPIVARTGGLADTVIDANDAALAADAATGFMMRTSDAQGLAEAVERADAIHRDAAAWRRMQRRAMKADFSWTASAARYAEVFNALIGSAQR